MKKMIVVLLAVVACSCNNSGTATKEAGKDTTTSVTTPAANYAYSIEKPDNWQIGSTANVGIALNCLKAWEEGKMDESLKYFGDTIRVQFDGLDQKMSNDSLKAFLSSGRNSYKSVSEKMHDWESVISKNKSEEWVTLWYTQTWETKDGIKDSSAVVNDLQLRNGKIIRLSEYNRKLH